MNTIINENDARQILQLDMIVCLHDADLRIKGIAEEFILAVPVEWDDERVFDDDYIEVGTPDRYKYTEFIGAVY